MFLASLLLILSFKIRAWNHWKHFGAIWVFFCGIFGDFGGGVGFDFGMDINHMKLI